MKLTMREEQVLVRIGQGHSNKEIARDLCISLPTVRTHRQNIYRKLRLHSTAELAIYAIKRRYVSNQDFHALSKSINLLTDREKQIMYLASKGVNDRQIANGLCVTYATIRKHRENIYLKMGFKSAAEMIAYFKFNFNANDESTRKIVNGLIGIST